MNGLSFLERKSVVVGITQKNSARTIPAIFVTACDVAQIIKNNGRIRARTKPITRNNKALIGGDQIATGVVAMAVAVAIKKLDCIRRSDDLVVIEIKAKRRSSALASSTPVSVMDSSDAIKIEFLSTNLAAVVAR